VVIGGGLILLVSATTSWERTPKGGAAETKVAVIKLGDSRLEDDIRAQVEKEREEARNENAQQDKTLKVQQEELQSQAQKIAVMQSVLQAMHGGDLDLPSDLEVRKPRFPRILAAGSMRPPGPERTLAVRGEAPRGRRPCLTHRQ